MKYIKNSLIVFLSILGVFGVVTLIFPWFTQAQKDVAPPMQPLNVLVANLPSDPVPVTGTVNVGNLVQVRPTLPPGAFSVVPIGTNSPIISGPDPDGTNYAITSITVVNGGVASAFVRMLGHWGSDCDNGITVSGPGVNVPAGETVHISYPQPFILSAHPGAVSCLQVSETSASTEVTVIGYRF